MPAEADTPTDEAADDEAAETQTDDRGRHADDEAADDEAADTQTDAAFVVKFERKLLEADKLDKMVERGLTPMPLPDPKYHFKFPNCGSLPPPVMSFKEVSFAYSGKAEAYLDEHQNKELLRFITCGSVDDGKSTLIGRLLYDSKLIYEDQLEALEADSARLGTQGDKPVRRYLLQQTMSLALSIRDGLWKYLDHKGSGGNNYQRDGAWGMKPYALKNNDPDAPGQLYDLATDPGETHNLFSKNPAIVESMTAQLEAFKKSGRSAPSRQQPSNEKLKANR